MLGLDYNTARELTIIHNEAILYDILFALKHIPGLKKSNILEIPIDEIRNFVFLARDDLKKAEERKEKGGLEYPIGENEV